jgi:hypothetical protein
MKIKQLLIIILLILYCYWMSDLYIFIYNNNIYNPNILDDVFSTFKVFLYILNYIFTLIIIVCVIPYNKINKILNRKINLTPWKSTN